MLALAEELVSEVGADYAKAQRAHSAILQDVWERIDRRALTWMLPVVYPDLVPTTRITPILELLGSSETTQEMAKWRIERAGILLGAYALDCYGVLGGVGDDEDLVGSPLPEEFRRKIDKALAEFKMAQQHLEESPTPSNAEAVCLTSRAAYLYVLVALPEYRERVDTGSLKELVSGLKEAERLVDGVAIRAHRQGNEEVSARASQYAESIRQRLGTLQNAFEGRVTDDRARMFDRVGGFVTDRQ